ncbi:metal ABC transporter permease [Micromonospora sp. MS34]|uniref:metal ABC transporter permease n=1 Tax=Micromonospora sp. MS34 TaxID=3385971 RepID=UPI0039A238F2
MDTRILLSLATGMSIAGAAAYLGSLMLSRRMALVAGPLGHLTLPGVALALLYGFDISLGAFPFVVVGVILIWLIEIRTKLPMEALTAVVFASGVAIAFLFLPLKEAETALVGNVSKVGVSDTALAVVASLAVTVAVNRLYRRLVLINISEDLAASAGVDVKRDNLLYLLLIAIVVALGVRVVGALLTAALVAIPPAAARLVTRSMGQYAFGSMAVGVASSLLGIVLFEFTGQPAGPLIVLISAAIFLLSLLFGKRVASGG